MSIRLKFVVLFIVFSLIITSSYVFTHYSLINNKFYKNDIKQLSISSLNFFDIVELNRCEEIETLYINDIEENIISHFKNFQNLNKLVLLFCKINSSDIKRVNEFNTLKEFTVFSSNIDLNGFNSDTVYSIILEHSEVLNFIELVQCKHLKNLTLYKSKLNDCVVFKNSAYILIDSSVFSSLDNIINLTIDVDEIQDISGILEMDSLETFCVNKDSISEEDVKLLEDKGITVTYTEN